MTEAPSRPGMSRPETEPSPLALLIVAAGPSRPGALSAQIAAHPALAGRVRLHALEDGDPELEGIGLILFAAAGAQAERLARIADMRWIRVLNRPRKSWPALLRTAAEGRRRAVVLCGEAMNAELLAADARGPIFAEADGPVSAGLARLGARGRLRRAALAADLALADGAPEAAGRLAEAVREAGLDLAVVDYRPGADFALEILEVRPLDEAWTRMLDLSPGPRRLLRRRERILNRTAEALDQALAGEAEGLIRGHASRVA